MSPDTMEFLGNYIGFLLVLLIIAVPLGAAFLVYWIADRIDWFDFHPILTGIACVTAFLITLPITYITIMETLYALAR